MPPHLDRLDLPMPDGDLTYYSYDELVDTLVDREGLGWTETFRAIWDDPQLRKYTSGYAADMLTRGAQIPIAVQRDPVTGALHVIDGQLRILAAWIIRLDEVPVRITNPSQN